MPLTYLNQKPEAPKRLDFYSDPPSSTQRKLGKLPDAGKFSSGI